MRKKVVKTTEDIYIVVQVVTELNYKPCFEYTLYERVFNIVAINNYDHFLKLVLFCAKDELSCNLS